MPRKIINPIRQLRKMAKFAIKDENEAIRFYRDLSEALYNMGYESVLPDINEIANDEIHHLKIMKRLDVLLK